MGTRVVGGGNLNPGTTDEIGTTSIARLPFLHNATRKAIFLLVLACLVFFAPYRFPVAPSVSLSYLTGFSNRAAFLFFASGCVLFALLTRGDIGASSTEDQSLGLGSLLASSGIALGGCLFNLFPFTRLPHGSEANYALNRLQMLLSGHRPYIDFEYAYGAAHLYVPLLFIKVLRLSPFAGFYLWWVVQWLAGTAMLWVVVAYLDFPIKYRRMLFWALFAIQIHAIQSEGAAYTPVRQVGSAFLILVAYFIWRKWRRPGVAVVLGIVATAIGLSISPELGVGVAAGLICWYFLLTMRKESQFTLRMWGLCVLGIAGLFLICNRAGVFNTLKDFAGGAYCYPLLPTLPVALTLCAYLVAACVATRDLLRRDYESMTIPLAIGGFAMLPAAMGRGDLGHLQIAAPAFLLGLGAIEALPSIRSWWRPLALYTLVLPIAILIPLSQARQELQRIRHSGSLPLARHEVPTCAAIYRTPDILPPASGTAQENCLDTGYYMGPVNAFTPAAIQRKIAELDRAPRQPILLSDGDMTKQLMTLETDFSGLQGEGPSLFYPRIRHQPLTYAAIFDYIQQNYTPDPKPIPRDDGWNYRVWRPKNLDRALR